MQQFLKTLFKRRVLLAGKYGGVTQKGMPLNKKGLDQ